MFLEKLLKNTENLAEILNVEAFLQFIDYFPQDKKIQIQKKIIEIFVMKYHDKKVSDPVSIHNLLALAADLNPVKSLKFEEKSEEEEVSKLIIGLIRTVDFGQDVEAMLNLLQ